MRVEMTVKGSTPITAQVGGKSALKAGLSAPHGTSYYPALIDKPKIEGVTLEGDKTFGELGLGDITPQDIDKMLFG